MWNVNSYLFWLQFKMLFPVGLILGGLFVILFIAHRRYIREVQQREAEEEARMKATLSPEDFNQWLLRREIRRAGNNIASSINVLNANMWNKKGN